MGEQLHDIINSLESLQYDILFWKRKEEDAAKRKKLADYDDHIEEIIDKIFEIIE